VIKISKSVPLALVVASKHHPCDLHSCLKAGGVDQIYWEWSYPLVNTHTIENKWWI